MSDKQLVAVLVLIAGSLLVGLGVIVWVYLRYRPGIKAMAAVVGAVAYTASPVDVIPELIFGPVGLLDDATVISIAAFIVRAAITARRTRRLPR